MIYTDQLNVAYTRFYRCYVMVDLVSRQGARLAEKAFILFLNLNWSLAEAQSAQRKHFFVFKPCELCALARITIKHHS